MNAADYRNWLERKAITEDWAQQALVTSDQLEERGQQMDLPIELWPDHRVYLVRYSVEFSRRGSRHLKAHLVAHLKQPIHWTMCRCGGEYDPLELHVVERHLRGRELDQAVGNSDICRTCERYRDKDDGIKDYAISTFISKNAPVCISADGVAYPWVGAEGSEGNMIGIAMSDSNIHTNYVTVRTMKEAERRLRERQ